MSVTGTVTAVDRGSWGDRVAPSWRVTMRPAEGGADVVFDVGRIEIGARVTVPVLSTDGHAELAGGVKVKLLGAAHGA